MYVCFSFLKESLTFVGNTKLVSLAIINKTKYTNERRTRQPVCPLQFCPLLHKITEPTIFISPTLIRHAILQTGINANVLKRL